MSIIILLILTAILWGSSPILEKFGLTKIDPITALIIRSTTVTIFLLPVVAVTGKIKDVFLADIKTVTVFAISGIMAGLLGMWTYFGALRAGAASKIVPIAATYPLITAILSIVILKEQVTAVRLMGTILIIAGIWLVK